MTQSERRAYWSLITNDRFLPGLIALDKSLRKVNARYPLNLMVTSNLLPSSLEAISDRGIAVREVEAMMMTDGKLQKVCNPQTLEESWFTKLHVWDQTSFDRIIFLDADVLVLDNIDELFDLNVNFAAAPCFSCPDKFNSGVMVLKPSQEVFQDMLQSLESFIVTKPGLSKEYSLGDQGFLNSYFSEWYSGGTDVRLSSRFNCFRHTFMGVGYDRWQGKGPAVLHYARGRKPWEPNSVDNPLTRLWREIFESNIF